MPAPSPEDNSRTTDAGAPERKETFLARYPRKLKIAAALLALIVMTSPFYLPKSTPSVKAELGHIAKMFNSAHGIEQQAANPNPSPDLSANGDVVENLSGSESLNPQDDHSIKLSQAPDPGLTEDTSEGSLPRIAEDGRQPWQVYARPFNTADKRPRIAIIIADVGLSRATTDAAIDRLPASVTLAFDVQSPVTGAWCARARQDGHETLLALPMEPFDYPRSDPGPNSLLTTLPGSDNIARLLWALRQGTGYVGVTSFSGSRFTTDPDKLAGILDVLKQRGLMVVDARVAPHSAVTDMALNRRMAVATATGRIDSNPSPAAIDAALTQLEQTARLNGRAIGIASPLPVVLDRLQVWLKGLPRRGFVLTPISSMVK